MKINRSNYEEYFLLYTDNELSTADKQAVEFFIQQNPDLQKEFTMLQQRTFSADDTITFRNKEALMHEPVTEGLIHHENYQEMFILYSDEELKADEKFAVEDFVYHHPQYQEEFELIQSLKLVPDTGLTFPGKSKLYHPQPVQVAKRLVFTWSRVAVAAAVLIIAGVLWLAKPGRDLLKELVKSDIKPSLRMPTEFLTPESHITPPSQPAKVPPIVLQAPPEKQDLATTREDQSSTKSSVPKSVPRAAVQSKIEKHKMGTASTGNTVLATNTSKARNSPQEENDKIVQPEIIDGSIAAHPVNPGLTQPEAPTKPVLAHSLVQTETGNEPSNIILASNDNEDALTIAGIPVDKKGSIRGLFRKASRFIDKNTSIRPAKKQGLVIGNIEIAFQ